MNLAPRNVSKTGDSAGNADVIKIKRPQGGGTVRNIPIKDYQASIVHNIGTLRRSMPPQSQFESLVSEPEKNVYAPLKKRHPLANSLNYRSALQTACTAAQMEANKAHNRVSCHFCNSQHDPRERYCTDIAPYTNERHTADNTYVNKSQGEKSQNASDIDEYFHRNTRRRFNSHDHRATRQTHESSRASTRTVTSIGTRENERTKASDETETVQLGEGHVGQKISAYERNARPSPRGLNPRHRLVLDLKRHRTIGVPLVGMHNACGLPVITSWQDHEFLEPLRISHRVVGTLGPACKSLRTVSNVRRRTHPKRKAPQPDHAMIQGKTFDRNVKKSTVKSVAYLDTVNGGLSTQRHRRSFTTPKVGSLSSKNSFKRTTKSRKRGIRTSLLVDTFGRKSIKAGHAKRTTLYAKDDGEEPVQVLKNLCLNPLARTNPETDMIW